MKEYFANEIVQSCGKGYEIEVTKAHPLFLTVFNGLIFKGHTFSEIMVFSDDLRSHTGS